MKLPTDSCLNVFPIQTADVLRRNASWKSGFGISSFLRLFARRATSPFARVRCPGGFTLVEMMVASASASMLIAAVVALGMFTGKSFSIIGNYVDLDAQSRHAADVMSRQIRDASALVAYSTNDPSFLELTNSISGQLTFIIYSKYSSTLWMANLQNSAATTWNTLLTHCDDWTFSLYDRAPNISSTNITFNPTMNPAICKMINMSWKCSRSILGAKFNTETVQTAEIVLRNQITY